MSRTRPPHLVLCMRPAGYVRLDTASSTEP